MRYNINTTSINPLITTITSRNPVPTIESVLSKVTGEDHFPIHKLVEEKVVEILLNLTQEERLFLLGNGQRYFSDDA